MKYIEIAKGGPVNRGIIIPTEELVNHISEQPLYRSVYLYDEEAIKYVEDNGSLKNYLGGRYIAVSYTQLTLPTICSV